MVSKTLLIYFWWVLVSTLCKDIWMEYNGDLKYLYLMLILKSIQNNTKELSRYIDIKGTTDSS